MPTPAVVGKQFLSGSYKRRDAARLEALAERSAVQTCLVRVLRDVVASPEVAVTLLVQLKDPRNKAKLFLLALTERTGETGAFLVSQSAEETPRVHVCVPLHAGAKIELLGDGVLRLHGGGRDPEEQPAAAAAAAAGVCFQVSSLLNLWSTVETLRSLRDNFAAGSAAAKAVRSSVEIEALSGVGLADPADEGGEGGRAIRVAAESSAGPEEDLFSLAAITPPEPAPLAGGVFRKPDAPALKQAVAAFVKSAEDPDDITVADVLKHIASVFGEAIVGKYGYSKAFIDGVVYRVYGELEPPSLVLPGLWLGSEYNAADLAELQRCGVSHVLNVAVEIDRFFPERFTYMKVHIVDEPDANLLPFFDRACEFIDAALSKGTGVLVHCQRGVSRSAACVVAYVMMRDGLGVQDAVGFVKQRRRIVKPNKGFLDQLERWGQKLRAEQQPR